VDEHVEVHDANGHRVPAEKLARFEAALTADEAAVRVDDDGVQEPDASDILGELLDVTHVFPKTADDSDLFDGPAQIGWFNSLLHQALLP
jgi:hypothetical protein